MSGKSISELMELYEKLGAFYLGREVEPATGEMTENLVLYDSKDLTTHAVCVGMTGSGKTGLCVGLLEEALMDGVPAIAIDLKGDLTNLMLTFPDLKPEDFQPWLDPGEVAEKGVTREEYAKNISALWKKGLADWGQDGERIRRLRQNSEFTIYTPGDNAGVGLSILKSFNVPAPEIIEDTQAMRDKIQGTVTGLLSLVGINVDPIRSREHILLSNIIENSWLSGKSLGLPQLIQEIQKPPFSKIGVMDIETFYPGKERFELAMTMNNLLASPSFSSWMEGEALNIQKLYWTEEGKPRLSILYLAHLSEDERMFFVTLLLNELIAWMRTQEGTGRLRALCYMDEVFGYFPPSANPPSKKPMLTLLKQARAFGIGMVLATQNPVDLDYKGLSNAGTWLIGRLQTERDKMRVLDGLEGASSGSHFDRATVEKTLSGLGKRVFLLHNVHEKEPILFQTRWAMSYLRGPMTREQVKELMRDKLEGNAAPSEPDKSPVPISPLPGSGNNVSENSRPVLPAEIKEVFFPFNGVNLPKKLIYKPVVYWEAMLHYSKTGTDLDLWKKIRQYSDLNKEFLLQPFEQFAELDDPDMELFSEPEGEAAYSEIPSEAASVKRFAALAKSLKTAIYRNCPITLLKCSQLKLSSKPGETPGEFRIRLREAAMEATDAAITKIRDKYQSKFNTLQNKIRTAEEKVEREKSQYDQKKLDTALSFGSSLLDAFLSGGKKKRGWKTAASRAGGMARERGDFKRSQENLKYHHEQIEELEALLEEELTSIKDSFALENLDVVETQVAPKKTEIEITRFVIGWKPGE